MSDPRADTPVNDPRNPLHVTRNPNLCAHGLPEHCDRWGFDDGSDETNGDFPG